MIGHAFHGLETIFKVGYEYKKCGIILNDLSAKRDSQLDFFGTYDSVKDDALMLAMDQVNRREGRGVVKPGVCGTTQFWQMLSQMRSQAYTTRWTELLKIGG